MSANTNLSANRNTKNIPILTKICWEFTKMYALIPSLRLKHWNNIVNLWTELNWNGLFKQIPFSLKPSCNKIVEGLCFRLWLKGAWIEPEVSWFFNKSEFRAFIVGMYSVYSITPFIRIILLFMLISHPYYSIQIFIHQHFSDPITFITCYIAGSYWAH